MADAAVLNFLVGKLTNIIEKEIHLLGGVGEKVERVQRDLTIINCCLKDADSKRKKDSMVQNWLNHLRDVAYRIEDATDTFFIEVEDDRQKNSNFLQQFKKLLNRPFDVKILHKLGTELDSIQNELEWISKRRVEFGIKHLQDVEQTPTGEAVKMLPNRRAAKIEVNQTEIVGLQEDQKNILKLLSAEATLRRSVITIVGTGGLGKTTLASMVYNSAKADFKYSIMLSISKPFSLTGLLRDMLLSISQQARNLPNFLRKMLGQPNDSVIDNQDVASLINNLKNILSRKRYLIILDDVWEVDLWNHLKEALPDVNNGSRVLMTSRFIDIAKSAGEDMKPYVLDFLNDTKSRDLLLKKALRSQQPDNCPSDLLKLADELSKKCKGLPLALIVLGGLLLTKGLDYHAWNKVLQTLDWHSEGKDCMDVLAMSYDDMPYYLKACFLYLASFPEGYKISAKCLIRMLVAEGFLPQEARKTMEETAENCLDQLFERSIIQVSRRCMDGSIKCFEVHDLLRDLAVHEARQENFVTAFSEASDVLKPNKGIRRASVQFPHQAHKSNPQFLVDVGPNFQNIQTPEFVARNTRSLLLFGFGRVSVLSGFVLRIPKWFNFRLLKVLELVGVTNYADNLVKGLNELIHVKYLGLRNCKIPISSYSFHHMKTLETLDMRGTEAVMPNALWTMSTLRHVLFDDTFSGRTLDLPSSPADLSNLQTMRWVWAPRTWAKKLPLVNNLRILGINYPFDDWVTLTNLLQKLPYLVSLGIKGNSLPVEIVYPKSLPKYENLQSLYLKGKWSVNLEASHFPPHLIKLTLIDSKLEQNPMPELGKLKNLKKLCLREHVMNYSGPTICPKGFPVLQYLEVGDYILHGFKIEQGGMLELTYLQVRHNTKIDLPDDLQHVTIKYY